MLSKKECFTVTTVLTTATYFKVSSPVRGHPLSTYAKFLEKLTFLTPWYVRVRIRWLEMLVFGKILCTYLMDDP